MASHAKEVVPSIYEITDPDLAAAFLAQLGISLQDDFCPPEVRHFDRTLTRWSYHIPAGSVSIYEPALRSNQRHAEARQRG